MQYKCREMCSESSIYFMQNKINVKENDHFTCFIHFIQYRCKDTFKYLLTLLSWKQCQYSGKLYLQAINPSLGYFCFFSGMGWN